MEQKTVLIIEDEEDAAELFAEMMRVSEGSEYIEDQISRIISFVKAPPVIDHYQVDILS